VQRVVSPVLSHSVGRFAVSRIKALGRVAAVWSRLPANDGGVAVWGVIDDQAKDTVEGHASPVAAVEAESIFL